jgi:hypothetical protein
VEDGLGCFTDLSLGEWTTLELPWEADLPKDASLDLVLDEIQKVCRAVIAGCCEHRFGFLGILGRLMSVQGNSDLRISFIRACGRK